MKFYDEELSQSKARVAISEISLFLFLLIGKIRHTTHSSTLSDSLLTIVSYLAFSVCWYYLVKKFPNKWPARRYVSLVADISIMTIFFHLGGMNSSIVYPIFLWIIIGNGIRFGERFLSAGIVLGAMGFTSIILYAPFWSDYPELSGGLLAGAIILPIFFFGVLKRLKNVNDLEMKLAQSRVVDKAKDEFLAAMSHELRTPMNGVLGMAETLRESELDGRQKEQLHIITRSVESLLNIINDILDYSKLTTRNLVLDLKPVDLKETLTDVQLLMESEASEKGLKLIFDYPEDQHRHFIGDGTRIRQMVFNLLGNAIKFTEHGKVEFGCRIIDDGEKSLVQLEFKDTGIGIPQSRLASIFGHFEQADSSTTRKYDGTGLGLSISRQLARLMGGGIEVQSEEGKGSFFTISMMLERAVTPAKNVSEVSEPLPDFGFKALVVEDNKFNQVVVLNLLKKIGISCKVAENGQQALEMIGDSGFDLVFMDVRMPIMNGYEATEAIRARNDHIADIPILALTGEATPSDVARCLHVGMNLHLSKPVRLAMLVKSIQSLGIAAPVTS